MRTVVVVRLALSSLALGVAAAPAALADHPQPGQDISKLDYAPEGFFKAGAAVPPANSCAETTKGKREGLRFNPSGKYNAFDSNVFEVLCLPFRNAGDTSDTDPEGNGPAGSPQHGFCSPNPVPRPGPEAPLSSVAGECPNHQLEYVKYYEETMQDILGPYGVTFRRYEFENPGSGNTSAGRAINPAAIVPGADHPDETVIIGAHYDQTTEGPASAWDSAEGHAQVIRVARLMADYWKATGTRPSATVKFIPWDGEESGTLGSLDYTENNIVPGQEGKVRGYFNTDPCAGGYPAYRFGNPADRIGLGIQIARPEEIPAEFDRGRVASFNLAAPKVVEDVFSKITDTVPTTDGQREVFISARDAEASMGAKAADTRPGGPVVVGDSRPVLFSSDWANFLEKGVPFFNPGPEVTGPSDEQELNNPDGIAILHTPNDNIETLNRMTSPNNPLGKQFSAGWMKGMEMCANLLAWGMLRSDQGGAQKTSGDVVAYFEALPNEAQAQAPVTFDARGSQQLADAAARTFVDDARLEYSWDFGDGTTGSGETVRHAYAEMGRYTSKLTVRNTQTGQSDTMAVPITVIEGTLNAPVLADLPAEDPDGTFPLAWQYTGPTDGLAGYEVDESSDYVTASRDEAEQPPAGRYAVTTSDKAAAALQPWQPSDSATPKFRGNQKASGSRSFWTGISPQDFAPAGAVQSGESVLTLKEPIAVPAGDAQLTYSSLFQNEGDDSGIVEAAVAGTDEFRPVDRILAVSTVLGGPFDPAVCNPSEPQTLTEPLRTRTADLSGFGGKSVVLRFRYILGPENRALSQPCGWYIDDIDVSAGRFAELGRTAARTFEVKDRQAGTYAYRVKALYDTGVRTKGSNVEIVKVTRNDGGGTTPPPPPGTTPPGSTPPGSTPLGSMPPGSTPRPGSTSAPGATPSGTKPAPPKIEASVTRRLFKGGRLRLACRLAGAEIRRCVVRVQVVRGERGGRRRTLRTLELRGRRSGVVKLGPARRIRITATVTSTSGRTYAARRSLDRR